MKTKTTNTSKDFKGKKTVYVEDRYIKLEDGVVVREYRVNGGPWAIEKTPYKEVPYVVWNPKIDQPPHPKKEKGDWEKEFDKRFVGRSTGFSDWLTPDNGKILKAFISDLLEQPHPDYSVLRERIEGMKIPADKMKHDMMGKCDFQANATLDLVLELLDELERGRDDAVF